MPSCVILGQVLELGTCLCTVGIVILTCVSPRAITGTKHIGPYGTLNKLKGNLPPFGQNMGQLEAFIFFLGNVLKGEGWARKWVGVKYQDAYLPFLTTYLRCYKSVFLIPAIEYFDIFRLQSEKGNWPFLRKKECPIYKLKKIFSKSNSDAWIFIKNLLGAWIYATNWNIYK